MEAGRYCTVVFLNTSQAFGNVWYDDLLYKIKNNFPSDFYILIKSYLLYTELLWLHVKKQSRN